MNNSDLTYGFMELFTSENQYEELSYLHKEILNDSLVSNMSKSDLVKFYKLSIKNELMKVIVVMDKGNVIGSISYSYKNSKSIFFKLDFFKLLILLLKCILKQPINSVNKLFYRFKTYAFLDTGTNIPFLFIDDKYRNRNIGTNFLKMIKKEVTDVISVDTSTNNNVAISFYLSNEFDIVRKNNKITLFIFQKKNN